MNYSSMTVKSGITVLSALVIAAACCTPVSAEEQLKFTSVEPTVFFVLKDNILTQVGEATINNSSQEEIQITLQPQVSGKRIRAVSATVPKGKTTVKFVFPDIDKPGGSRYRTSRVHKTRNKSKPETPRHNNNPNPNTVIRPGLPCYLPIRP